jgi:hypothetical protein
MTRVCVTQTLLLDALARDPNFLSSRSCLRRLDLPRLPPLDAAVSGNSFLTSRGHRVYPLCRRTTTRSETAGSRDQNNGRLLFPANQNVPQRGGSEVPRRPLKPRPWVPFGGVGETTTGPRDASTGAGATRKLPLNDYSHQAPWNLHPLLPKQKAGPSRPGRRDFWPTTERTPSTPTSPDPAATAPDRGGQLPEPASLSLETPTAFVTPDSTSSVAADI